MDREPLGPVALDNTGRDSDFIMGPGIARACHSKKGEIMSGLFTKVPESLLQDVVYMMLGSMDVESLARAGKEFKEKAVRDQRVSPYSAEYFEAIARIIDNEIKETLDV